MIRYPFYICAMSKDKKIHKTLVFSFYDGVFASSVAGLTNDYITPFALALKATTRQIGILTAVPFFFSSLVQLAAAYITEKFQSRKKVMVLAVTGHALMFFLLMLIPYFFKFSPIAFLIGFVALLYGFGSLATPVWASLMCEYIPAGMRGRYFGWRGRILNVITVLAAYTGGFILQFFKSTPLRGFAIIFGLAFILRMFSAYFLTKMYEPRYHIDREAYFSFVDFIKRIRHSNFAQFTLFVACLHFCVNLAAPFFSVFMLRDLKFNYLTYTFLITTVSVSSILVSSRWGIVADRIGNAKITKITAFMIATLPLWWLINRHPLYLFFVQVLGGITWAGFNLSATNFIYDAVTPQKRIRCIAYLNTFSAVAVTLSSLLGGHLAMVLPQVFAYKLLTLFLLSSALRFLVVIFLGLRIKEVRTTQRISTRDLCYLLLGTRQILETEYKKK